MEEEPLTPSQTGKPLKVCTSCRNFSSISYFTSVVIIDHFLCLPHTESTASSHSPPSSPTARERASSLLKSLASPLNPTKRSLPPNEKSFHHSDLVINRSSARSTKEAAAQVRRSKSFNDPAMRAMSMAGSSGSLVYHPLDLAITGAPPLRTRALSAGLCICFDCKEGEVNYTFISAIAILMLATYQGHKGVFSTLTWSYILLPGSSSSLPRPNKPRKAVGLSPLATHESRAASTSPTTGEATSQRQPTADSSQQFFEHGIGSQIMLASSGSQAKQLLLDRARRTLEHSEVEALQGKLKQVHIYEWLQSALASPLLRLWYNVNGRKPYWSHHHANHVLAIAWIQKSMHTLWAYSQKSINSTMHIQSLWVRPLWLLSPSL